MLEWDQFWNGICLRVMIVTYMITILTCRPFVSERKLNIFIRSNFGQNFICPRQGMPLGWKKKPHFTTENSVLKYIWCKNRLRSRLELKKKKKSHVRKIHYCIWFVCFPLKIVWLGLISDIYMQNPSFSTVYFDENRAVLILILMV